MIAGKALAQLHRVSLDERRERVGDQKEGEVDEVYKTHYILLLEGISMRLSYSSEVCLSVLLLAQIAKKKLIVSELQTQPLILVVHGLIPRIQSGFANSFRIRDASHQTSSIHFQPFEHAWPGIERYALRM